MRSEAARVSPSHLGEPAEAVRQAELIEAVAAHTEKRWARHDDRERPGPRHRHVEAVAAVQKLHPAGNVLGAGGCKRNEYDRSLLALELVDSPYSRAFGQDLGQQSHLSIVRSDDQDLIEAHFDGLAFVARPRATQEGPKVLVQNERFLF